MPRYNRTVKVNLAGTMNLKKPSFLGLNLNFLKIETRILLPFLFGCILLILLLGSLLLYYQKKNTDTTAIRNVKTVAQQMLALRVYYSDNIVNKALQEGTEVTYKYKTVPKSIPLPATIVKEFGEHLTRQFEGIRVELYSEYPFPNRHRYGGLDDFQKDALSRLQKNPEYPYYTFQEIDSIPYVRYALADRMQASCIQCHNTHPESPKKDWKVGDVRGILEISMPVKQAESGADMILFSTVAILIGLGTIFIVNNTRNKENESMILELNANLEQKVETRTAELAKSNEDLMNAIGNLEKLMRNLRDTQHQLVLSEKLAALGQLAAGISHELNTPLGAISSSCSSILEVVNHELKNVPILLSNLSPEDSERFNTILEESLKHISESPTLPNRGIRQELARDLENSGIKNPNSVVRTITDLGIHKLGERLIPLLRSEKIAEILAAVASFITIARVSNVIWIATDKASRVVNALKSYLRPKTEGGKGELYAIDVQMEIENILILYHNKINYEVEIVKNYKTEKRCLGEADKLNQVWINLLNNALQSMNYKGKIEIETREQDSWVVVSWTDSGTGIPETIQNKIFDPFFTTKKHGEGMGLGLDICKKIIDSFGGKIEFQTAPGRTKFSVWLQAV
ncbi:PF11845 family protein [Leptospira mayottensis 200901122]|uniref:histidine kinase n=2 Tax=Leptospira mayottensis TaxID=1137606 RepID=A0AA87SXP7_9LEPT|nr:PF11845 family protein [Leptospira mayottensis 200901122]